MIPTVSVIMSYYNEELSWLKKSVNSILNQTYKDYEFIIIVDNPNICREVDDYFNMLEKCNDNIIIYRNKKNIGLALSLNEGIKLAKGKYIARMDADDVSECDRIKKELFVLESHEYDMVFSNKNIIDEKGNIITKAKPYEFDSRNVYDVLSLYNCVVHPSVLVKKDILETMNGYRNFKQAQDYDLWLRMLSRNYKIGVIDEPLINYRVRSNSISQSKSLLQFLTSEYQKKLFKQRKKEGEDHFSNSDFNNYLLKNDAFSIEKNMKFYISGNNLYIGLQKLKNKEISGIILILQSVIKDKRVIKKLIITIKFKLIVRNRFIKS